MEAATEERADETTDDEELTKAQEEAEANLLRQIEAEHKLCDDFMRPKREKWLKFAEIARQPTTEYFLTGGVRFAGKLCLGVCSFSSPIPETGWLLPIDKLRDTMLSLHQFKTQPRMHFKGTDFSCEKS
jgi:hypothetical protein